MKTPRPVRWTDLVFGAAAAVLGLYTLFYPASAIQMVVIAIGVAALIGGLTNLLFGFMANKENRRGYLLSVAASVLSVAIAILILFNVRAGAYLFSIYLPIWFVVHCLSRISNLKTLRSGSRASLYWSALVLNVLGILLAALLLLNPLASILSVEFLIGSYLFLIGIGSLLTAFGGINDKAKQT